MLCAICLAHLLALRVELFPDGRVLWPLETVEKVLAEDAANGHKLAQVLSGKIARKVVKQTVSSNVISDSIC